MRKLSSIIFISLSLLTINCGQQADFFTSHGTGIYHNNIPEITCTLMENAIEFFITEVPKELNEVSENDIRDKIDSIVIIWEPEPFDCKVILHETDEAWVGKCNGLWRVYRVRVVWYGHISDTGLFHEMMHFVIDDVLDGHYGDVRRDKKYWSIEKKLNKKYRELYKY